MSKISNRPSKKKDAGQARLSFDTLSLESKNLGTALLLLDDTDGTVIAQALASLDKYATKDPENATHLISLDILPKLIPLMDHSEIFVRRFATKVLAELSLQEETKKFIMEDPSRIQFLSDVLIHEEDVPLQEFSSDILAELTKMGAACADVLETDIIETLFTRIKALDPDVQNNSARIMVNLLSDPEATPVFLENSAFDFIPILQLLQSEYPAIQGIAIEVLDLLTKHKQDKNILEEFIHSKGLEDFIDILEKFDWKDLHPGILTVLQNVASNSEIAHFMGTTNLMRRLVQYMDDIHDDALIEMTLDTISKIASSETGRKILLENNVMDSLLRYIKDDNAAITRAACTALGNMMKNPHALEIISKENPLREIMGIIRNETFSWDTRHGALMALSNFLERDRSICEQFINLHQQDILFLILKQPPGKVPEEVLVTILHCLAIFASSEDTRANILEVDITEPILTFFERQEAQLLIAACFCLSAYVCETKVQENFLFGNGPQKLLGCLKSQYMPVRQAAASLLQLLALDPKIAEACINAGVLDWMKEQKESQTTCPSWETAIETLFRNCLSAKFYYLGRLDIQDVTGEVFYVLRKHFKKFIVLDKILSVQADPLPITYVANFGGTTSAEKGRNRPKVQESGRRGSVKGSHSPKIKEESESDYNGLLQQDPYLIDYVEQVKALLKSTEEKITRCTIPDKVAVLALFVASKMCGVTKERPCTNHINKIHITELKYELGSSIIPLGFIRVGLHLERAVLFKVLADQLGIPCALIRGEYGRTWIEIALPQIEPNEEKQSLQEEDLPTRLLRPNYIVDLMDDPGKLYPLGSFDAAVYCALPSSFG